MSRISRQDCKEADGSALYGSLRSFFEVLAGPGLKDGAWVIKVCTAQMPALKDDITTYPSVGGAGIL